MSAQYHIEVNDSLITGWFRFHVTRGGSADQTLSADGEITGEVDSDGTALTELRGPRSFLAHLPARSLRQSIMDSNEICVRATEGEQPMDLHRFWDGVITSSANLTRLRNEATALRNRQEFKRSQLTELANPDFEPWAKESFEIAAKIAYRNGGRIGISRGGNKDCRDVQAAPLLPPGYVVSASRIADRRMILAGYRLVDLLTRLTQN